MAICFNTKRRIEFAETDMAGIAHFSSFFRYMEEVEHAYFRSLGISVVHEQGDTQLSWPRVSAECEFFKPIRFEDVVDVELELLRRGKTSLTFGVTFLLDDQKVASGRLVTACCSVKGGKLRAKPIPTWLVELLADSDEQDS